MIGHENNPQQIDNSPTYTSQHSRVKQIEASIALSGDHFEEAMHTITCKHGDHLMAFLRAKVMRAIESNDPKDAVDVLDHIHGLMKFERFSQAMTIAKGEDK